MNGIGGAQRKIKPAHQPGRAQNIAALDVDKLGMTGAPCVKVCERCSRFVSAQIARSHAARDHGGELRAGKITHDQIIVRRSALSALSVSGSMANKGTSTFASR